MIRTRFIVTLEVEAKDEAESWRLFCERLNNGEGKVETTELYRSTPNHSTMLPSAAPDTIPPPGRNGDTLPCSGVVVKHNIHQQR